MRLECAMLVGIAAPVSSCSSTRGTTKIRVSSMSGVVIDGRSGCAVSIHLLVFMAIDLAFEKPSASVFAYRLLGEGGLLDTYRQVAQCGRGGLSLLRTW